MAEIKDTDSWNNLKREFHGYMQSRWNFVKNPSSVEVIKNAFSSPEERALALDLVAAYPESDRVIFFGQLISLASYVNGFTESSHNLILGLPHDWVMRNIEAAIDELLADGGYEEYRCLLELCCKLDRELMRKFAQRALNSPDEDIREAGTDFLSR